MNSLTGSRVRQATSTAWGLALCLALAGCNAGYDGRPDPSPFNTPPLNAYALSGGRIKHFVPQPGLADSSADKAMLLACRQLPVTSSTARSAMLVVTAGQFGKSPLHALVVGNLVLMLPGDLVTMGMNHGLTFYKETAPDAGVGSITLIPNSRTALVGQRKVMLHNLTLSVATKDLVMTWADMLVLFKERDRQRHQPPFIRNVQVIYDIRDYHR